MSEHVSFTFFLYLPFLHAIVLPEAQQSNPPTHFKSPGWRTICWLYYLPRHLPFCFSLNRHWIFTSSLFIFSKTFLNMSRFWALSIFFFSIPVCPHRLSRANHQHIFSRLAGVQFTDCITCFATNHFVSIWADSCLSASSLVLYIHTFFSLNMSEHVSCLSFIHLPFYHPTVPPQAQQSHPPTHF